MGGKQELMNGQVFSLDSFYRFHMQEIRHSASFNMWLPIKINALSHMNMLPEFSESTLFVNAFLSLTLQAYSSLRMPMHACAHT